ncbi:MAG TPA: SDR family oxidoreductase [Woeseiaceae bacterium]|nr:SDR family oxidoreductase [Woeseiaceae bacterium]
MHYSLKPLNEQVIVITGASSGIGLATARAAAARGARVVLSSRNAEALEEACRNIQAGGRQAIRVVADVGRREEVENIAEAAIGQFGGFDTWVNNAGVSIYGRLEEITEEDARRLFDTNFWGVVSGSLVAAAHLKSRGGAIINVGSELSDLALPMQGMYSASKHAVKGFTDALRMELQQDKAPISMTLIKPAGIDTRYPEHAKNYTSKELTLPPPVYAPEEVAHAILFAAEHAKRDIFVGSGSKLMSSMNARMPAVTDWLNRRFTSGMQFRDRPARHREGALQAAGEDGHVQGNYAGHVMKSSLYTRASLHPVVTAAALTVAGVAIAALLAGNGAPRRGREHLQHLH